MTTGYSTLTAQDVRNEIKVMRQTVRKLTASPKKATAFLVKTGFLSKNGKKLAAKYR